jgi:peroxiredoxin
MTLYKFNLALLLILFSTPVFSADYGLIKGAEAPQFSVNDIQGKKVDLAQQAAQGPVVIVFYRGGWCPYCNLQLRNLEAKVAPVLKKHKAKLIAISVDKVDEALKTANKEKLTFQVVSDPDAEILKAYNVRYKVPETLVKKYKDSYKIDLEASSGRKHHVIAVPAVYVVGPKRVIAFAYANEDYKVRAQEKDIIKALEGL